MKKIYYYLEFENISPIHIGNGENEFTDFDIIKDKNGEFYIPGTSLAGCFIHYLDKEDREIILPKTENKKNKQSPAFISDARMIDPTFHVEVRTGIKTDENKLTIQGAKYDYEVITSGKHFKMLIEVIDRDNKPYEDILNKLFLGIQNNDIKVGFKTTRGLGKLKIHKLGKRVFDKSNFNDYFKFNRYDFTHYEVCEIEELNSSKYIKLEVELKQKGGLSIRTFNTSKGDADFEHIKSNDIPIIPATSWNGMIRKSILTYVQKFNLDIDIDDLFGCFNNPFTKKSKVIIEESVLTNGYDIEHTRICINPFTFGNVSRALYKGKSYYHGDTKLVIKLDKRIKNIELVKQLFILTFIDMKHGFIALGGETSIGKGLFDVVSIEIDGQKINVEDYVRLEG